MKLYTWTELKAEIIEKYGSDFVGASDVAIYHNETKVVIKNDAKDVIVFRGEEYSCDPGWFWVSGKTFVDDGIAIDCFYAVFRYTSADRTKQILNVIELDKRMGI